MLRSVLVALVVTTLGPCSKEETPSQGAAAPVLSQDIRPIANAPNVAASVAAAASIGAQAPAPNTPGRDVCKMLTNAEVKAAAGVDVTVAKPSKSGNADVCTWSATNGTSVVVQVYGGPRAYDESRRQFETLYKGTAQDVPGVGDKAFYIFGKTFGMGTSTMSAMKGSTPISVQVLGMNVDDAKGKQGVSAVAKATLAKL